MSEKDTYKTSKTVFRKQLNLNLRELGGSYPVHWNHLLEDLSFICNNYQVKRFIDIGCGCGTSKKLIEDNFKSLQYQGFDYSENAIEIAKEEWKSDSFFVKDCFDFQKEDFDANDIIYMSALGDVLNNADELFEKFLNIGTNYMLFYRVRTTDKESFSQETIAYDDVHTFSYYHNLEELTGKISSYGYQCKMKKNNENSYNLLLLKDGLKSTYP